MNKKEQYVKDYFAEQKERSKRYIVIYVAFFSIAIGGLQVLPSIFLISNTEYNLLTYALVTIFIAVCVYWYLAIKPSEYVENIVYSELPKQMSQKEKLTRINETFEAVKLYEHYIQFPSEKNDLSELSAFIEKRRDVFPINHEYHIRNDANLALSSEVNRKLFITTLTSIRDELIEEDSSAKRHAIENRKVENADSNQASDIFELTNTFTSRLKKEIELLTKRANIYITFGSTITVGAAFILYYMVSDLSSFFNASNSEISASLSSSDWFSIASRFSIVVFVEVFAFYYLRLYRSTMDTVKFYQNEITNIEMRLMAVHSLATLSNPDSTSAIALIDSLAKSERNFVIEKGQSTVDIEKQKVDSNQINSIFDGITKLSKVVRR